ncbi:unnamed protein product [Toxocara canis]|uniref:Secreted protein n=1 Tax=Toxocara canis TaxID=6265 RepID=A0A183TXN2_TOXCA|nr:unnamed protein product [Toxocara canis]
MISSILRLSLVVAFTLRSSLAISYLDNGVIDDTVNVLKSPGRLQQVVNAIVTYGAKLEFILMAVNAVSNRDNRHGAGRR